jgi:putative transposase
MRYPDGGGLSAWGRVQRERVRLEAARLYEQGVQPVQVARRLRVSPKSAYQWRRWWRAGGDAALASKGPGGATCRLTEAQLDRLRSELKRGPAEHGFTDQRWTLARITLLIGRLFHLRYTLRGTSYLLHRIGFTV